MMALTNSEWASYCFHASFDSRSFNITDFELESVPGNNWIIGRVLAAIFLKGFDWEASQLVNGKIAFKPFDLVFASDEASEVRDRRGLG
jgi:hypothetical protein